MKRVHDVGVEQVQRIGDERVRLPGDAVGGGQRIAEVHGAPPRHARHRPGGDHGEHGKEG